MSDQHNQDLAGLVEETIRTLYDKGIAAADLAPLVKLHNAVKAPNAPSAAPVSPAVPAIPSAPETVAGHLATSRPTGPYDREGRRGEVKASEDLMARTSAIIDVLVQSGQTPETSAQTIARQLLQTCFLTRYSARNYMHVTKEFMRLWKSGSQSSW